mgnify:CR=1 FL=1
MEEAIAKALEDGKLPCEAAFAIARGLGVKPLEVKRKADEMGIKISRCQLGLFGYGSKRGGKHRIVNPPEAISAELETELRHMAPEGLLPCAKAWAVARRLGISKLEVSGAAEALGIRIVQCQLGCF